MRTLSIYPAIDLKNGACVRLLHGEMGKATVYNKDPAAQAAAFSDAGFAWVHVVDLDGAFAGQSRNAEAVSAIMRSSGLKGQLGGGIRNMADVEHWLGAGMTRVILGTAAVRNRDFVCEAARVFSGRIMVGIDAREGRVKTDGWDGDTAHTPVEVGKWYEDQGVNAIIYTDIGRDGALTGVNVEATAVLADALAIPVIASGGVASVDDVKLLARAHENIEGVIIGRALYDGRISADAALAAASGA